MTNSSSPGDGPALDQDSSFGHYSGKVSRQASIFLLGTLSSVLLGYLFKAYLGRVLGPQALGIYALGLQTVGLLVLLASLGLPAVLARYVAVYLSRSEPQRIRPLLHQSILRTLGGTALAAGLLCLLRHPIADGLFGAPELAPYLPLFALLIPLSAGNHLLGQYLRGHQEVSRRTIITHFVQLPLKIAATVGLIVAGLGLTGYVVAELVSQVAALILLAVLAKRLTPSDMASSEMASSEKASTETPGLDAQNLAYGRHMMGLEALRFVNGRIDILLLGVLAGISDVGIYSMAVASAAFVPTLLRALVSIFGPIISALHSRGEMELLQRLFRTTTRWCLGLTWPLVAVLVVFAPTVMGVFGEAFRAGSTALVWLVVGQLIHVATGAVGNLLVMSGHQRLELGSVAFTAMVTVTAAWLCIPRWGIEGAAAAVALGLALANVLRVFWVWRRLGLTPYDLGSLRLVLPLTLATACPFLLARWMGFGWIALGLSLAASYGLLVLTALPFLSEDDRLLLRQIRRRASRPKAATE